MTLTSRKRAIETIEKLVGCPVLSYVTTDNPFTMNEGINDDDVLPFDRVLHTLGGARKADGVTIFIYTRGGDANSGWRILDLLRHSMKYFDVIVPFRCHSTGTEIALGARKIIMTRISELGSIDLMFPISTIKGGIPFSGSELAPFLPGKAELLKTLIDQGQKPEEQFASILSLVRYQSSYEDMIKLAEQIVKMEGRSDDTAKNLADFFTRKANHNQVIKAETASKLGLKIEIATGALEEAIFSLYDEYARIMLLGGGFLTRSDGHIGETMGGMKIAPPIDSKNIAPKLTPLQDPKPRLTYIESGDGGFVKIAHFRHESGQMTSTYHNILDVEIG